jgi:hypothetical protein
MFMTKKVEVSAADIFNVIRMQNSIDKSELLRCKWELQDIDECGSDRILHRITVARRSASDFPFMQTVFLSDWGWDEERDDETRLRLKSLESALRIEELITCSGKVFELYALSANSKHISETDGSLVEGSPMILEYMPVEN